jgi:hypothetical protein
MLGNDRIDAWTYHRDIVPGLLAGEPGRLAAAGTAILGDHPRPLTLVVADGAWTYRADDGRVRVEETPADGPWTGCAVRLSQDAWTDLVRLWRSAAALAIAGEVEVLAGTTADLFAWEPLLRAVYQGIEVYVPDGRPLTDRLGRPVDPARVLSPDDTDADLAAHFEATGVMRVRGVFSPDEIAALGAEVDRLAARARPGDDRSWWADTPGGDQVLCRLVYAGEDSPVIAALAEDPRLVRLATLLHPDLKASTDRMEGIAVLLKPPGRLTGLANIPWHTDCGLGGHTVMCPSVAVGVQLTGSTPETGCLEAVAGTHGRSAPATAGDRGADSSYVLMPTAPGDVTVHVADVLHASPAPTGDGGRRTIYVTFHPPALFEHVGPGSAFNDLIRRRTAGEVDRALG